MKRILASVCALVLAINVARAESVTVSGRVDEIRPAAKQILLKSSDGKPIVLKVDDRSDLRGASGRATLADIKAGDALTVTFEKRGADNVVLAAAPPAPSADELSRQVRDTLESAREYAFKNKDQYIARLQTALKNMDIQLDDLRRQARSASGDAKKDLQREIADLEKKRDEINARMPELRRSSAEAWTDLKKGFSEAANDFQKALEKARSRFRD